MKKIFKRLKKRKLNDAEEYEYLTEKIIEENNKINEQLEKTYETCKEANEQLAKMQEEANEKSNQNLMDMKELEKRK